MDQPLSDPPNRWEHYLFYHDNEHIIFRWDVAEFKIPINRENLRGFYYFVLWHGIIEWHQYQSHSIDENGILRRSFRTIGLNLHQEDIYISENYTSGFEHYPAHFGNPDDDPNGGYVRQGTFRLDTRWWRAWALEAYHRLTGELPTTLDHGDFRSITITDMSESETATFTSAPPIHDVKKIFISICQEFLTDGYHLYRLRSVEGRIVIHMISPHQTTFEGIYEEDFLYSWLVNAKVPEIEEWWISTIQVSTRAKLC